MTTPRQDKPLKPVVRDELGRIMKGSGPQNPGGISAEQRAAKDALNRWLCDTPQLEAGKEAYLRLLREGNPHIVKDFMDRVAGKVKEIHEVQGDSGVFAGVPVTRLLAALAGKETDDE